MHTTTDHRHTLSAFLRTDLFRLEAALEGRVWGEALAEPIADHLRFALQVQAVYLEGVHPRDEGLQAALAAPAPARGGRGTVRARRAHGGADQAIQGVPEARLHAPVLDAYERGLTVLGHLYDFCRANAVLVERVRGGEAQGLSGIKEWFDGQNEGRGA